MQIDVVNEKGQAQGKTEVPDALFATEVNETLLWEMVKAQRASRRRGTHKTKKRGEVRGGGRKPLKQKGSGQARQGSERAPNHVGGGTVFGPQPRDYSYRLPRTARVAALKSALSSRAQAGAVVVVEGLKFAAPNTKRMVGFLQGLGDERGLVVVHDDAVLRRSARNLQRSKCLDVAGINVYDILDHNKLVFTREALAQLIARLLPADATAGVTTQAA